MYDVQFSSINRFGWREGQTKAVDRHNRCMSVMRHYSRGTEESASAAHTAMGIQAKEGENLKGNADRNLDYIQYSGPPPIKATRKVAAI